MTDLISRLRRRADVRIAGIFLAVFVILQIMYPSTAGSFELVLSRTAITGLVALGMTVVIIQAQLDLSVGSTLALSAVIAIMVSGNGVILGLLAAIGVGIGVGLANGLIVTRLHVHSFIATLGTMIIVRGIALWITGSAPVTGGSLDASLTMIRSLFWFLTPPILIVMVGVIVAHLFLSRTRLGRDFYAVGGNIEAARASGTPVNLRIVQAFMICGFMAGLGGWVTATELSSANPNMSPDLPLLAIAAVVLGGAHLTGGRGTAIGTAIGALLIALIATTLDAQGISSGYQAVVTGVILLVVVIVDQVSIKNLGRTGREILSFSRLRP